MLRSFCLLGSCGQQSNQPWGSTDGKDVVSAGSRLRNCQDPSQHLVGVLGKGRNWNGLCSCKTGILQPGSSELTFRIQTHIKLSMVSCKFYKCRSWVNCLVGNTNLFTNYLFLLILISFRNTTFYWWVNGVILSGKSSWRPTLPQCSAGTELCPHSKMTKETAKPEFLHSAQAISLKHLTSHLCDREAFLG